MVALLVTFFLPGFIQRSPAQNSISAGAEISYPGSDLSLERPVIELANQVLGINDRCVTCHKFDSYSDLPDPRIESTWEAYPGMSEASISNSQRWLTGGNHPGGWLNWHPPQEFGCTICHGGNGQALDYAAAGHRGAGQQASRLFPMQSGIQMDARCGACHPGDYLPGAEDVWRGRILIRELNCATCHPVNTNLTGTRKGPSLARVGEKLTRNQVAAWPNHYNEWVENSRMPEFNTREELTWLVACYLVGEDSVQVGKTNFQFISSNEILAEGLDQIKKARCANCHVLPRPAGVDELSMPDPLWDIPHGTIGPDLTHISARVSEAWVFDYLMDPAAWYPETRMPKYKLPQSDLMPIVVWLFEISRQQNREQVLASHKHTEPAEMSGLTQDEKYALGQEWFVRLGCKGCHETNDNEVPWRTIAPSLKSIGDANLEWLPQPPEPVKSLEEYFIRKLLEPDFVNNTAAMPRYALSDDERRQISAALLAEREAPSPRYLKRLNGSKPQNWDSNEDYTADYWPRMLEPQGAGSPLLSRFERDLSPQSCATCHREQYMQWDQSRHAKAMAPGVTGQLIDWISARPGSYNSCMRCHARLASQNHIRQVRNAEGELIRDADGNRQWEQNPHFQEQMYTTAHGCANCHVRAHERHSVDDPRAEYSWDKDSLSGHELKRSEYLSQSEFCKDCHQFERDTMVEPGLAPRENTYAEWLDWSATAEEPKSCQECHMPDGDHSFKGIHDQDYVAENINITSSYKLEGGVMSATIILENSGGGHHLPTYITPKIFVRCYFTDSDGEVIEDSLKQETIGRGAKTRILPNGKTQWFDEFDTRIPAGDAYTYIYRNLAYKNASTFHLEIFVAPDDFYHALYKKWVQQKNRSADGVAILKEAMLETRADVSGYYLLQDQVDLD